MRIGFGDWLRRQGLHPRTIGTRLSNAARIEQHHGCLDRHYEADGLASLVRTLTYSTQDERHGRANPSRIPFVGVIRTNLAMYKSTVRLYGRFREQDRRSRAI